MFQLFMNLSIITSSLIFMQMNHPLAMGLMLLIQTFIICLATGIISKTFWFSYILFLVFLGGMLVLFIYVTSLASNEMFSLSMKTMIWASMMFLTTAFLTIVLDMNFLTPITENIEMMELSNMNSLIKENSIMLNKIYNYPTNLMTLVLINYLLISLIAIVKITNVFYGPLRQMN
uniref:NADH-ubiquinone oxidoreductase chain 6 n=1 Tax=Lichtwardtia dentalis TaxID=2821438 RepID=A0A8B0JT79_9MUSC|nr:NADH dehydrogenase subunit 6 [Lichtwardtia dentalis]QTV20897.1 NADH dehydrogenase subunit 6 [Lichtwardtia dentalis]